MKVALTATPSRVPFAPIVVQGGVAEGFSLAAELGYDGVELHLRQPSDIDPGEVMRLASRYGLGVPTLGTGLAASEDGLTFTDADRDVRRRAVDRVKEHVRLAADLGSAVTIGRLSGRVGQGGEKQQRARRADSLTCIEEVCRGAEAVGVTVLLEPLNRYECDYINTVRDVLCIVQEIGAHNLQLLADTFHMNIEEADIGASLQQAGSLLRHVHFVDSNRQAPGRGHLDMAAILQTLRQIGYQGYLSLEILPVPGPREALEHGISSISATLAKLSA